MKQETLEEAAEWQAERMYHSSINRVKHDAFNNRKYIPLTNPTWTI
jgi:hypothetical protein